jgi:hypothetical protein
MGLPHALAADDLVALAHSVACGGQQRRRSALLPLHAITAALNSSSLEGVHGGSGTAPSEEHAAARFCAWGAPGHPQ